MMDTQRQRKAFSHSNAFHEEQLPLFDAYVTDELNADERTWVEQNVQHCQECQHLFTQVTHLRQALGTLSETANPSVTEHTNLLSPSIVHAVQARIEQQENNKAHFTADPMRHAKIPFHSPDAYSPARLARKRIQIISFSIGVAMCCILLFVGLIILFQNTSSSGNRRTAVPAPMVWTTQQPMLIQNSAGVFALKQIEITTKKEFRFYYAFQSPQQGTIHATAVSVTGAADQPSITLATTVLSLGTIDDISVGVIRVQYLDRVGQTITLSITSPEESDARWQITPLKQLLAEPHPEGGGFYGLSVDQYSFPAIIWSGPISRPTGQSMVSLFKNAVSTHYVFLEVDYAGKVIVITKEQCIQLVGEQACH